ncbi:DUF3846 domain-containing protein [Tessaracoccus palaemonis]|uniref:DUF3846 domain-containing protein n=1 Tax=Tessaracoccus palaemonis TaxID=2829499 RepID=A0ABX8SJ87_9ACTN|nr:DUF3846 domain-containing protein [Tessaracoccus palaemonis]QXT62725.1 DUF3846 domain-containing protein [Tessaracoccus palaemonis]
MSITGLILHALDHTPSFVEVPDGDYRAMADVLGCQYIEHVRTRIPGVAMIVDDEGALDENRQLNLGAAFTLYPGRIFGDVLVFSEVDGPEGRDVTTLTPEHMLAVCNRLGVRHVVGLGREFNADEPTEDLGLHRLVERGEA